MGISNGATKGNNQATAVLGLPKQIISGTASSGGGAIGSVRGALKTIIRKLAMWQVQKKIMKYTQKQKGEAGYENPGETAFKTKYKKPEVNSEFNYFDVDYIPSEFGEMGAKMSGIDGLCGRVIPRTEQYGQGENVPHYYGVYGCVQDEVMWNGQTCHNGQNFLG